MGGWHARNAISASNGKGHFLHHLTIEKFYSETDEIDAQSPAREESAQEAHDAVVDLERCDDVVVRRERLEDRRRRGQARGKSRRDGAAFDQGEGVFKGRTVRIIGTGVAETRRIISVRSALKRRGEMDRLSHRAARGVDSAGSVNRDGLQMQLRIDLSHGDALAD